MSELAQAVQQEVDDLGKKAERSHDSDAVGKTKKASAKKASAKKTTAKKAAAKKTTATARHRTAPQGALVNVAAAGKTYIQLTFETGAITITPTSNRETNRDVVVKSLRALLR